MCCDFVSKWCSMAGWGCKTETTLVEWCEGFGRWRWQILMIAPTSCTSRNEWKLSVHSESTESSHFREWNYCKMKTRWQLSETNYITLIKSCIPEMISDFSKLHPIQVRAYLYLHLGLGSHQGQHLLIQKTDWNFWKWDKRKPMKVFDLCFRQTQTLISVRQTKILTRRCLASDTFITSHIWWNQIS